jgi:RNA polymerase sigma factor (sigma-70 family)
VNLQRGVIEVETRTSAEVGAREIRVISDDELSGEFARLTRVALLLCRDPGIAEDFAAEAITRALRRSNLVTIDRLRPYLRRTLINLVTRDQRRKATESLATVRGWSRPTVDEPGGIVTERGEISRALDSLSHDQRVVVVLRYLEDMSPAQVAETLRIPLGTVTSRTSRATATLRSLLEEGESNV